MTSPGDATSALPYRWIPVRSLGPRHRPRIERHLLGLDAQDRYWRFGYSASDERVRVYVRDLDFGRDELFGVFNRRLEIVAMAHLAYGPAPADGSAPEAEFAVSVQARSRGRGFGMRLFERAIMHARNRGIGSLTIHALSENAAMLHLARKAGAAVQRHGSEAEAHLKLPPEDWGSRIDEMVQTHAAELNYRFKAQALLLDDWLDLALPARQSVDESLPRRPD